MLCVATAPYLGSIVGDFSDNESGFSILLDVHQIKLVDASGIKLEWSDRLETSLDPDRGHRASGAATGRYVHSTEVGCGGHADGLCGVLLSSGFGTDR